jgi:hypothetical protein
MSSSNLIAELVETTRPPMTPGASIYAIASFWRAFLNGVVRLGVCAGNGGGLCAALLTLALAVLAILFGGDPGPTPTPIPLPF